MTPAASAARTTSWVGPVAAAALAASWLLPLSSTWKMAADLGHSWAVPFLVAYLWWERWSERPPARENTVGWPWWVAVIGAGVIALPLRLLLTPYPLWPSLVATYTLLIAGIAIAAAWLAAGRAGALWVAGPLVLLITAVPWPTLIEQQVILPLREIMASLAAEISNLIGRPALAGGTSVRLAAGWVGIDEACGGIRSLQACVMGALFFGEWFRFSFARRLALILAGIFAALLGNFLRVLFLSLRAGESQAAIESVHDIAGWAALTGSLVLTGWMACRWGGYRWPIVKTVPRSPAAKTPAARWLLLAAGLLVFDEAATRWWFAHREAAHPNVPQWTARFPEGKWDFSAVPLADYARDMLKPDFFAGGTWHPATQTTVTSFYIEWRKGQAARFLPFLHNPTVCLPMAGCELVDSLGDMEIPWSGGVMPFHTYHFRQANEELLVAFVIWDPSEGRPLQPPSATASYSEWFAQHWADVIAGRENQPAQLLSVVIDNDTLDPRLLRSTLMHMISQL